MVSIKFFLILTGLLVNSAIVTAAVLYLKYALSENKIKKIYIKWIPAALLALQSIIIHICNRYANNNREAKYALQMVITFVFCIVGDILLIYNGNETFIIGMASFLIFYIIFGYTRLGEVYRFIRNNDSLDAYDIRRLVKSKAVMVFFIMVELLVASLTFGYLIMQIASNHNYDTALFFVAVVVYFITMTISSTIHLIYLFIYKNLKNAITYTGIFIFMLSDFLVVLADVKYNNSVQFQYSTIIIYWIAICLIGNAVFLPEEEKINYYPW